MRIITALGEALLIVILFALFTLPFAALNHLSALQANFTTIAQNIGK